MTDLSKLSPELDIKKHTCRAIIETPKGSRNKFNYDPESGLFKLGGLLPAGMMFPYDFGFIPSTVGGDGDPLDILLLIDAPTHVGCILEVRIIGVLEAAQEQDGKREENDRFVGVACHSYDHQHLHSVKDVGKELLCQVEEFFINYNKQRGKKFMLKGVKGPDKAMRVLQKGLVE